jgi:hypothetical protein
MTAFALFVHQQLMTGINFPCFCFLLIIQYWNDKISGKNLKKRGQNDPGEE